MDETIAQLRAELSRRHGPARVPVLLRIGQMLVDRYWRAGPGAPAALGQLSAAIEAMEEAYGLLKAEDPFRLEVGVLLGWWLTARYGAHGGAQADRETAIAALTQALEHPELPPMLLAMARLSLGQLYLGGAIEPVTPAAARGGFLGGTSPGSRADAEQACRHFREILDGPPTSAEVTAMARTMLNITEVIQPLLTGDLAGLDFGKLLNVMTVLQQVRQNGFAFGTPGSSLLSSMSFDISLDPIDYPGTNLQGDPEQPPAVPPRRPVAVPPRPTDPQRSRQAVRDRLATLVDNPGNPVWEQARMLLEAGPERVSSKELDALVGAAANAVDAAEDDDPVESGLDRLLSAIGLCLRERREGTGWEDGGTGGGQLAAAELLLAAASRIPAAHPAAVVVVETLGGLLDQRRPLSGAIGGIAGPLAEYAAELCPPTVTVTALGELCRAITALAEGTEVAPDRFASAVDAVPEGHAWQAVLSTAVGQVWLAAAVRAGDAVAVDADPDGLAPLLEALLHEDIESLRAAVTTLAGIARTPRLTAVAGAGYLELASRAPGQERNDLTTAIWLLTASTDTLDDADERLRTRTWWRLAEAYRRRGEPADAQASRDAGFKALGGSGLDPRSAARFAGWMLADGCAVEAFTALEIAAVGSGRAVSAAGPLAEDVLTLLLGIAPRITPLPDVPAWPDVAGAVRTVGASALLYLHPTDDVGRTAGVLCLDPATHRLDILANVPVTDPLTSNDPGWAAIAGRWAGGSLLVAVTDGLRRIALPAVCTGNGRRLAQDASVAYVASGAQVIELAGRETAPAGKAPLFVVNPRGDRDAEMADVLALRRLFYPRSACVGRALESVEAAGGRADVLSRLPGASLIHLACGLRGTQLELAEEEVLDVAATRGGGLVILAESAGGEFGPTAQAFLGAGFSGVIGWQWPVPTSVAALAAFMIHLMLVEHHEPPAVAVAAVQQWMVDPDRELPPLLPLAHRHTVRTTDLTRPTLWAALAYYGC